MIRIFEKHFVILTPNENNIRFHKGGVNLLKIKSINLKVIKRHYYKVCSRLKMDIN